MVENFEEGLLTINKFAQLNIITLTFNRPRLLGRAARMKGESSHEAIVLSPVIDLDRDQY